MIIYILCISGLKSDDPRISSHLFSGFESIKTRMSVGEERNVKKTVVCISLGSQSQSRLRLIRPTHTMT